MKKVIFLDIDGPIIPMRNMVSDEFRKKADPIVHSVLKESINDSEHDIKIVVISVWRRLYEKELRTDVLKDLPFHNDWRTKDLSSMFKYERPYEVEEWLSRNDVDSYLIVDDEYYGDFDSWKNHCINVDGWNGLNYNDLTELSDFCK